MEAFDAVKVFSATKARDREALGNRITSWLREAPRQVADVQIRQSSDREFHCLSVVIFYRRAADGT
jgi:hypothetical protein